MNLSPNVRTVHPPRASFPDNVHGLVALDGSPRRLTLAKPLYGSWLMLAESYLDLRAKYRQLVAQGKPRKAAVVAVMRKLLVLANALLLEQDRCWLPERPGRDSAPFVTA